MQITHHPALVPIIGMLEEEARRLGLEAYVVGGYVRDRVMRPEPPEPDARIIDLDVVVVGGDTLSGARVAEAMAARQGLSPPVIFERFGTAQVTFGEFHVEFVAARSESYAPESRKPDVRPATLEEDVRRRDFTCNTLLVGSDGLVIDLTGQGLGDIEARLLRTPLPAQETFAEDPLRAIRAVRFAATLGFAMDPEIPPAIEASLDRLVTVVSIERVTEELRRMLLSERPGEAIRQLRATGILGHLLPEVDRMAGVSQSGYHSQDVFEHTLTALDSTAARPRPHLPEAEELVLRLGILTHDIGKPQTAVADGERITFLGHPDVGATTARRMLRRLRFSNELAARTARLVSLHMRPIQYLPEEWTDGAIRRLVRDAGDLLPQLLLLARADMAASEYPPDEADRKLGDLDRRIESLDADAVRRARPSLDGEQLMARYERGPGPWIRRVQDALLEAAMDGELALEGGEDAAWAYLEAHPELLAD